VPIAVSHTGHAVGFAGGAQTRVQATQMYVLTAWYFCAPGALAAALRAFRP
jgi:hypothetical protein